MKNELNNRKTFCQLHEGLAKSEQSSVLCLHLKTSLETIAPYTLFSEQEDKKPVSRRGLETHD